MFKKKQEDTDRRSMKANVANESIIKGSPVRRHQKTRRCPFLLFLMLGTLTLATSVPLAFGTTVVVTKDITFRWDPANVAVPGAGSVTWGKNTATDYDPDPDVTDSLAQSSEAFLLKIAPALSFPAKAKQAQTGQELAKTEISVNGLTALAAGKIEVGGKIEHTLEVGGPKGGKVVARGKINLTGKSKTTKTITVDGVLAKRLPAKLTRNYRWADPIHLTADNGIEIIDSDVFEWVLDASFGAGAGLNDSLQLELDILVGSGARAEFTSTTFVPWATDLSGSAILDNGIFTATGIYADLGLWNLEFDPFDPLYVIRATLIDPAVTDFSVIMSPAFGVAQEYDFTASIDLLGELEEVPEPATLSLLALGGLALSRRRKKRYGNL